MAGAMGGLSTADVDGIREALAAGRKPRVQFTAAAGQVAGQSGQVVGLTDPRDGEEFIVVRFGRDELPFSPADVVIAPKGARRSGAVKSSRAKSPSGSEPPEPAFVLDSPAPHVAPAGPPAAAAPASGSAGTRGKETVMASGDQAPAGAPRPRRAAKPKAAGLTVTLSYRDGEWTVAAHQGSKALAKPYLVKPAEALAMVGMLDVPGVREAVEQIIAAERSQAQEQAQRLREQLAEVEAKLAELA